MYIVRLLAFSLCISLAHAAPAPDVLPGLVAPTEVATTGPLSDLAAPSTFDWDTADFNDLVSKDDEALRVFPTSDGGYWLVGHHAGPTVFLFPPYPVLTVAKFMANGYLDPTYNNGTGKKSIPTPLTNIVDVAQGPFGTLYALGSYTFPGFTDADYGVYCVDADGNPCAGFGSNGLASVALDLGSGAAHHDDYPARIVYAFSSLYLAGTTDTGSGTTNNSAIGIVKMSAASGAPDAGFGTVPSRPGVFFHNFDFQVNGYDEIGDLIAFSPAPFQVRLVVVGTTQRAYLSGADTDGFIGAIDGITGQLDPLFDPSGFSIVAVDIGTDHKDRLERVIRRANGSFLAAGTAKDASATPAQYHLVLAAFRADGSADPSFGTNGLYHSLVLSGTNRPFGLAERAQNRDIVVGINILDDLAVAGDGHPMQAVVQFDSSAHIQHAVAIADFSGTPKSFSGTDLRIYNNIVATAGYRQWSAADKDWDMTIVRYVANDSIFADRFGGTSSD